MLNKHNLALVGDFASKEQSRYTLTAIQVTERETIATNGYYIVRVTRPVSVDSLNAGPDAPGIVPFLIEGKQAKEIGKALGKDGIARLSMNGDEGRKVDLDNGMSFHAPKLDGTFPNCDAVMPSQEPAMVIGFDSDYLLHIARAFSQFQDTARKGARTVKVSLYDPQSAIKMEATNDAGQTMVAVLMPRRA